MSALAISDPGGGAPPLEFEPYRLDDGLLAGAADDRPRAAVYRHPGVAVVLGHGSRAEVELDAGAILADGVPILRRRGGGCAVVLDPGNLVVSLAARLPGLGGIRAAYDEISAWLIAALERAGVPGVLRRGSSDLAIGERKIGGACMYRSRDLVYYTTTLLHRPDLELVERYLPHPPREPDYRRGRAHRDFMGAIAELSPVGSADRLTEVLAAELSARPVLGAPPRIS